ncbi:hypothetical protein C8Q74DRAFT_898050 [Fomes fomentarius]|nr:hypothetical protein C8Q74DRAFT_898050 [Fomes fomentarius]
MEVLASGRALPSPQSYPTGRKSGTWARDRAAVPRCRRPSRCTVESFNAVAVTQQFNEALPYCVFVCPPGCAAFAQIPTINTRTAVISMRADFLITRRELRNVGWAVRRTEVKCCSNDDLDLDIDMPSG